MYFAYIHFEAVGTDACMDQQLQRSFRARLQSKYKLFFGSVLHRQGRYKEAKVMLEWALAGYENALGLEHLNTIEIVLNFAKLYYDRGKFDKAGELWKRALAGYKKAHKTGHQDTLNVIQNLGLLYHSHGKLNKAEEM